MKIVLCNPAPAHSSLYTLRDEICFQDVRYSPFPMRLGMAAALLLKDGHDVTVIDANAERMSPEQIRVKMPAADVMIFQSAAGLITKDILAAEIAKEKNKNVKTVLIENYVSPVFPERFLKDFPDVDFLVRGQVEAVVTELVKNTHAPESVNGIAYRKNGGVVMTPEAAPVDDVNALPFMACELFPMNKYSISYLAAPMYEKVVPGICMRTTRDCPYECTFCVIGSSMFRGYDKKWRVMSPERAADEVANVYRKYGLAGFFFWDETFTLDQKRAYKICEEIIKRNLKIFWRCLTRIDCVNEDLLRKMGEAGCQMIEYGIESGNKEVRHLMNKKFTNEQVVQAVAWTKKAGIRANCDFIVGMPWESKETLKDTLALAKAADADNVHLTVAFPYPETAFYDMAQKENLLRCDDIYERMIHERVRADLKPVADTRHLKAEDVERAWRDMRDSINRYYFFRNFKKPGLIKNYIRAAGSYGEFIRLVPKVFRRLKQAIAMLLF